MLLVPKRRRSRRVPERDPCERSEQIPYSAPDGTRTHTGAGLSRLPLPLGYGSTTSLENGRQRDAVEDVVLADDQLVRDE